MLVLRDCDATGVDLIEQPSAYFSPSWMEGYLPFAAPAGTPREILDKLSDAVREVSLSQRLKDLREQFGIPSLPLTQAAEVWREWDSDSAEWIALAGQLNLSLDGGCTGCTAAATPARCR